MVVCITCERIYVGMYVGMYVCGSGSAGVHQSPVNAMAATHRWGV